MTEYKGVMVFAEATEKGLQATAKELLGVGRKLADALHEELAAVIAGSDITDSAPEAITLGADIVYVVDDPLLKDYQTDACTAVMEKLARQTMPRILLLGQTSTGRDLAPRLAFRLGTVATTDCVELAIDSELRLLQTRPVYGGNALATFTSEYRPQIATIRAKVYSPPKPDNSRQGKTVTVDAGLEPSAIRIRIVSRVQEVAGGMRLEDASVIVAGGRGIGGADGFRELGELARLLKGAVGATRPPCDNGWVTDSAQIGLTGKIVAPDLYLAVALSGSSQHISGISGAKNVIAINKDPEANIFRVARFGVVGDWKKVLPAFTVRVKELMAE